MAETGAQPARAGGVSKRATRAAADRQDPPLQTFGPGGAAQGIPAGDFAKALEAIRAGAAYANVHTQRRPGGEVRGQIHPNEDHDH